ncbi:MAG: hypothetical protein CO141_04335 [Candidatus Moranbacteria bacterium CG_4_9_14_3_um_filter_42_9]|nr:MAG: hypothetical protein CO141_04335 [Candidatus Moranbacteria bacterium CG_4_9_14_3_um_filter_42_9]
MSQKINTWLGTVILIIISITAGVFVWKYYQLNPIPELNNFIQSGERKEPRACTMEAKLCADGTYVSRSGPNCEFAACPGESAVDTSNWQTYRNDEYGFEFQYPAGWNMDNRRISPQKIEDYEIGSDNAPIHFNIISPDKRIFLADNSGEVSDGRWAVDPSFAEGKSVSNITSNSLELKRYDWYDNEGKYEGDTSGKNIIVVSPEFSVNGNDFFVSFEWEQFPGGNKLLKNNPDDFIKIIPTFKFTN